MKKGAGRRTGSRSQRVPPTEIDAVDRGPRHAGQPVNLALAKARIDRGPDDLAAPAAGRVLLGGPAGQHLPGLPDRQLRHASYATFLQYVLQ